MRRFLAGFGSFARVHHTYSDPLTQQQAINLWRMAGAIFSVALVYLVYVIVVIRPVSTSPVFTILPGCAVFMGIAIVLINVGRLNIAVLMFVGGLYAVATIAFFGSPTVSLLSLFSVPIVAAGVLLNRRGILITLLLCITAILMIPLAQLILIVPPGTAVFSTSTIGTAIITLTANGIILSVFAAGQRTLLRRYLTLTHELRNSSMISQGLTVAASLDDFLRGVVDKIRDELGYYHIQIFVHEEKTGLLVRRASTSAVFAAETYRRIAPIDDTVINEALHTRTMVQVSISDPAERRTEFLPATQDEALIPLMYQGNPVGVIDVHTANPDGIDENAIEGLQAIGAQIAVAVHSAQTVSELQNVTNERDQLVAQLRENMRQIETMTRAASGQVWQRYMESRGNTVIGYDWQNDTVTPSVVFSPSLAQALSNAMPEIRTEEDERVLSVPVALRGQMLGAMEFRASKDQNWNNRSLELARIIAQRLALALDNVRLYEQAQIIANREQVANQIATRLQSRTDIDSLILAAAESFQQALGATRASVRLAIPGEPIGAKKDQISDRAADGGNDR
jgi:GAF domain-containing protein